MNEPTVAQGSRLERLLSLLEADPNNVTLIEDAAETALDEGDPESAGELVARYRALEPLPPRVANIAGLAAMVLGRFDRAAECFEALWKTGVTDSALLFNLAWCRSMNKDPEGALTLLQAEVTNALPAAAMLHVQILHELGEFEQAGDHARSYVERHPDYVPLLAAVSVLALDIEDEELAAACAGKAPDHPEAMTTLGTLALGGDRPQDALPLFDRALSLNQNLPRAWIGRGLAELLAGQGTKAAEDIDRGAELFGDHLGSWVAAGWAHFINKDFAASRARFEHALELDRNFGETHGSLAVLDLIEGKIDEARQRLQTAFRLDRKSFSAALAQALLAAGAGDQAHAGRIVERALNTPVDASGRTIAQALAKMGLG